MHICIFRELKIETFVMLKKDVLNLEMVGLEATVRLFLGTEPFLEIRKEDPSIDSGIRIFEPLQQ